MKTVLPIFAGLVLFASVSVAADELRYNPDNLSIVTLVKNGQTSFTVRDGDHWITNYPTFTDAMNAMTYMKQFNTICFEGRGTPDVRQWFERR